jgi:hypothetical protein
MQLSTKAKFIFDNIIKKINPAIKIQYSSIFNEVFSILLVDYNILWLAFK